MSTPRKIIVVLFSLVSLCVAGSMQSVGDVPLHGPTPPPGTIPHAPLRVPISCFVIKSMNNIYFVSSTIATEANVVLVNTSTGDINDEDVYISSIPDSMSLMGSGDYTVQITLPYGTVYYGEFALW